MRGRILIWASLSALLCGATYAQVQKPEPKSSHQLAAVAADPILWMVVGELDPEEKTFVNSLTYLDRDSSQLRPARGILPQLGRVLCCAVVGEALHVFYESGNHHRYSRYNERREVRLPQAALPLAVAGEPGNVPLLWAVVSEATAAAVAAEWAKTQRTQSTQPQQAAPATQPETLPSIGSRPAAAYALVSYDGVQWRPGFRAAESLNHGERAWLCASGGRFHLFWHTQGNNLRYAFSDGNTWTEGPQPGLTGPPQDVRAAVVNAELVLIALTPQQRSASSLRPEVWRRPARAGQDLDVPWNSTPIKASDGSTLLTPAGSAVAAFANDLVVLRRGATQAEVAFWDLTRGGTPDRDFRPVPLARDGGELQRQPGTRDVATLLVVALALVVVLWQRQGGFPAVAALPAGIVLTAPAKRLLGAILDMAPAAALATWWWWQPLNAFSGELMAAGRNPEHVAWPAELFWAGLSFRVLYTVYCLCFELVWNRTPGKWVVGCTVVSEGLTPPTWLQILVRNVSRLIELEPYLHIWPFLVVLLVTRSRQRIGDLLARTLVIDEPVVETREER